VLNQKRRTGILVVMLLAAPMLFANDLPRRDDPGMHLPRIIKRLLAKVIAFDEILTGTKP
jgi:hypothetical protein